MTSSYGLRSMSGGPARAVSTAPAPTACVDEHRQPPDRLRADDARRRRPVERLRSASPSCCATQPATATIGSCPCSVASCAQLAEPRVQLLLGVLAHAAGVDDDDVGVARRRRSPRSRPVRAARPSARSRGRSSGSRTSRSDTSCATAHAFAFRLSFRLSPPDVDFAFASRLPPATQHLAALTHERRRGSSPPPSIRASSSTRPSPSSRATRVSGPAAARPASRSGSASSRVGRDLRQVRDAEHLERAAERAAACCRRRRPRARRCRRRPRRRSASSRARRSCASVFSASMMRDSSPPDTMRASGRRSSPGFGETKNSAGRCPRSVHGALGRGAASNRTSNRVRSIASSPSSRLERARELERPPRGAARESSRAPSRYAVARRRELARRAPPTRSSPCSRSCSSRAQRVAPRDHVGERRAVLALQPLEQREPLLDLLQPRRRGVDAVRVARRKNARSSSCDLMPSRAPGTAGTAGRAPRAPPRAARPPPSAASTASSLS